MCLLPFVFEPYICRPYGNEAGLKIRVINYLWFLTKSKQTKNLHEPASYILSPFLSDPIFLSCGSACPGVSRTWQAKPQRFSPPPSQTFPEKSRHQQPPGQQKKSLARISHANVITPCRPLTLLTSSWCVYHLVTACPHHHPVTRILRRGR